MTIKQEVRSSETQIVSPLFLTVFHILLLKPWERLLILNFCFPCKKNPYYFFLNFMVVKLVGQVRTMNIE